MRQEQVSARNIKSVVILMILSNTVLAGITQTGQDAWIPPLIGASAAVFLMLLCGRLCKLFPGRGIFEIIRLVFGGVAGNAVIFLMVCYGIFSGALVLRTFTQFIFIISLQQTPWLVVMAGIAGAAAYLTRSGFETLGKWSVIVCVTVLVNFLLTAILSYDASDFSNLRPFFSHDIELISSEAFSFGAAAFGDTVLITVMLGVLKKGESPYKACIPGILAGGLIITLIIIRNILILGPDLMQAAIFPSYMAMRIIHIGSFLERLESLISFNVIIMGLTKTAVCMAAAAAGMRELFRASDYRRFAVPSGLLVLLTGAALCVIFKNMQEILEFMGIYRFIALPFQAVLPLCLWAAAEYAARARPKSKP